MFKKGISILICFTIIIGLVPINVFAAKISDDAEVQFNVTGQWQDGFNADVIITNNGDSVIENWTLTFKFPQEIVHIWNAEVISEKNGFYYIKNAGWNNDIQPHSQVSFGFSGKWDNVEIISPYDCEVLSECEVPEEDNGSENPIQEEDDTPENTESPVGEFEEDYEDEHNPDEEFYNPDETGELEDIIEEDEIIPDDEYAVERTEEMPEIDFTQMTETIPCEEEFLPKEDQEIVYTEPEIHEELLPYEVEIPDEDDEKIFLKNESEIATFSLVNDTSWDAVFADQFGAEYLSPYKLTDGEQVSGNTNRLVIEETDLQLAGKNGLDVVIKRRYDNQNYNNIFSAYDNDTRNDVESDRYLYRFIDDNNNEVYVAFSTEDDFYRYMYNGIKIKDFPNLYKSKQFKYEYYLFERIYAKKVSDTYRGRYKTLTYDPSFECQCITEVHENASKYVMNSRKLLPGNNVLYNRWNLIFPEAYLYRYEHSKSSGSKSETYNNQYVGAFRDLDGNVYTISGYTMFRKYKHPKETETEYRSRFTSEENNEFKMVSYYETQNIDDVEYNFTITDISGRTYYFYNTGVYSATNVSGTQYLYITAVSDKYGNMIKYKYNDSNYRKIAKIIDTYGREINISANTVWYDDPVKGRQQITYESQTLNPNELSNNSSLAGKKVNRLIVTNQNGEKTIYDSRDTETLNFFYDSSVPDLYKVPYNIEYVPHRTTNSANVERIIYPNGTEKHYKYDYIYTYNKDTNMGRGVYAVVNEYTIDTHDGNKKLNNIDYELSNDEDYIIIKTIKNNGITVDEYNSSGLLYSSVTSDSGTTESSPYISVENLYLNKKLTQVKSDSNGVISTKKFSYNRGYGNLISSETEGDKQIKYVYHEVDGRLTDMPQTITYSYLQGSKYIPDYSITTTLTDDKKNIAAACVVRDGIELAKTEYTYDSEGNVLTEKRYLTEDKAITLNHRYTNNSDGTHSIKNYVSNVSNNGTVYNTYTFDIYGNPIKKEDSLGNVSNIEYDSISRPVKYSYPNGAVKKVDYSTENRRVIVTDSEYDTEWYFYNAQGSLTHFYNADLDLVETRTYDSYNRLSEIIRNSYNKCYTKEKYTYDVLDRISQKQFYENDVLQYTETYEYTVSDKQSIITKTTKASDSTPKAQEIQTYDNLGRLVKTELSSGDTVISESREYDYLGNLISVTDSNGGVTSYTYDVNGNVLETTDALGGTVINSYDRLGRLIMVKDAEENVTQYTYDELDRVTAVQSPFDDGRVAYTINSYDKNSNLTRVSTRLFGGNGENYDYRNVYYKYDNMQNLITENVYTGNRYMNTHYWYDKENRVVAMQTGAKYYSRTDLSEASERVTYYKYDVNGYLSEETDALGNSVQYTNDYVGNPIKIVDKNRNTTERTYGAYGIKTEKTVGNMENEEYTYTYNRLGGLTKKQLRIGGALQDTVSYKYDAFGRMTEETNNGVTSKYGYDLNLPSSQI